MSKAHFVTTRKAKRIIHNECDMPYKHISIRTVKRHFTLVDKKGNMRLWERKSTFKSKPSS